LSCKTLDTSDDKLHLPVSQKLFHGSELTDSGSENGGNQVLADLCVFRWIDGVDDITDLTSCKRDRVAKSLTVLSQELMNGVDVPKRIELLLGVKVSVGVNGRTGVDSDLIAGKTGVSVVLEEALSEAESSARGFVG
jgi:hypothetical protein